MKFAIACSMALVSGCSLFGPPLPPATLSAEILEYEALPVQARKALVACARDYAQQYAKAQSVSAESIVDAAIYACSAELENYAAIATDRAKGRARILGWIDRSESYAAEAVSEATEEARKAALDAVIRQRTTR